MTEAGFQFDVWQRVQAGPLHGVNIFQKALSILRLGIGTLQAFWLLLRRRPAAVFLTGGWVGVPVAVAAWLYRIPIVIFVPDVEPGQTLKLLGRFASVIAATVPETKAFYPDSKTVIATGYPLREDLLKASREEAIAHFGLDPDKRTLLVFGGSRGSRAINRAVYGHIDAILALPDLQILHISGKLDAQEVADARQKLSPALQARYQVRDYVHEMGLAYAAADVVLSRAGASTLGENPAFQTPSILVPLAYEWHYQEVNADWLASRGAAIRLDEPNLDTQLVSTLHDLLTNPDRLAAMHTQLKVLAQTDGAENIARIILQQAKGESNDSVK